MHAADAKRFIRDYTDAVWNEGDTGALQRFYTSDYVHHDVSQPDLSTLDDYRGWADSLLAGLSEMRVDIDDLIAEPDGKVVKVWTASGRHTGELAGVPPTGRTVSFSGTTTYRLVGGRIAESWYVYDLFGLLQQMGAIPAAGSTEVAG